MSDVSNALFFMRVDAQNALRRQLLFGPRAAPAADARSRRTGESVDELVIGSTESCDISSAIRATNVVRSTP